MGGSQNGMLDAAELTEEKGYAGPAITSMCPAVAMGLALVKNGQPGEDVATTIRQVSDLMAKLAREEREAQLNEWDRLIERAKALRGAEREA